MKPSARSLLVLLALAAAPLFAQPVPSAPADAGFTPLFDGKTLNGWDGDPKYWSVRDGCILGQITPETLIKRNTFLIWRGGAPKDFELKVEYRVSDRGNSGLNYRSVELTDAKWSLAGYQADIDGPSRHTGQNYEERGRTFLAKRGEMVHIGADAKPVVIASLGTPEELKAFVKTGTEWNRYHLIIRGNILTHILNGHVMSIVIDDDAAHRKFDGLIGVQVHVGPPMTIEYRSFLLKPL